MWGLCCIPFLQIQPLPFPLPTPNFVPQEINLMVYISELPVCCDQWEAPGEAQKTAGEWSLGIISVKVKHPCFSTQPSLYSQVILITNCVGRFSHSKQFLDTRWMSYNSTQFWHYLPEDSIRSHRLRAQSLKTAPTSYINCKSRLLSGLLTNWL